MSWYNFWKKKVKAVKRTILIRSLKYKTENMNFGKTLIRIDLEDGTILHNEVVGRWDALVDYINYHTHEPCIHWQKLISSEDVAKEYILHYLPNNTNGLFDRNDQSKAYYSKPLKAEIVSIQDYFQDIEVAYIEEELVDVL